MAKIPSRKFATANRKIPSSKFPKAKRKIPSRPFGTQTAKLPSRKSAAAAPKQEAKAAILLMAKSKPSELFDVVQEASEESFPASDSPARYVPDREW